MRIIDEWRIANGEWRVASGEWRVASGGWRVASGGWRVADKEQSTDLRNGRIWCVLIGPFR
ncbi:MAG: hypothetical protein KJ638_11905 [Chloroflexi bacterium]|nr:hypothetical protein [Chloroflexota bacterium]